MLNIIVSIFYKILYMSIIGSITGLTVSILIKLFDKKLSAKYKCFIWMISLMFFIIPFIKIPLNIDANLETFFIHNKFEESRINNYSQTNTIDFSTENQGIQINHINIILNVIIPMFWVILVVIALVIFFISNFNLYRKINNNIKCTDNRIKNILQKCKKELNIYGEIDINISYSNISPCIYGLRKSKIILPYNFLDEDEITIEHVFRHELSHYKRKDMFTNYLLIIMIILHWFNPLIYFFFKKIRQEIELATDELALKYMNKNERKMYGMTLINLLQKYENRINSSKILCVTDDEKNMERRIMMIKNSNKTIHRTLLSILVFVIVFLTSFPFIVEASIINNNEYIDIPKNNYMNLNGAYNIPFYNKVENDGITEINGSINTENTKENYNTNISNNTKINNDILENNNIIMFKNILDNFCEF